MAKIYDFPTKPLIEWNKIERILREYFNENNIPSEAIESSLIEIKGFYQKTNWNLTIKWSLPRPAQITDEEYNEQLEAVNSAFSQLSQQIHDLTSSILLHICIRELQIYNLLNEKGN